MALTLRTACRSLALSMSLIAACGPASPSTRASIARPRAAQTVGPTRPQDELYAIDEALRDALSGPLEFVGAGAWPGSNRIHACVFRNQRVLVVNVYCTPTEQQAFRIDVYSATRGRVRVYAESDGPISMRTPQQYFTFTAESEPPPGREAQLPTINSAMTFEQLHDYEERRYQAFLPGCFGGQNHRRANNGCLGALESHAPNWTQRNRPFLEHANAEWLRIVRELRGLAGRYGSDPQ